MRWRSTIAAGLVFVALLAWVMTQERGRVPEEKEVFGLDIKDVTSLRVERKDEKPIVIERRDDRWFITSPIQALADTDDAKRMIKAVAELKEQSSRTGLNLDDEQYGLKDPPLVAVLTYGGGKTARVEVGEETAVGSSRYARIGGDLAGDSDTLYIVGATVRTTLWKDATEIREKQVVLLEPEDVQRVELAHGEEQIVLARAEPEADVKWWMRKPLQVAADEFNVKQLVRSLGDMRAEDFLEAEAEVDPGFDKPQARMGLRLQEGRDLTVTFGKTETRTVGEDEEEKDIVYVRTSARPEIMMVEADQLEKVQKTPLDLRDRTIVRFERDDVQRIRVERTKGLSFTVARRPDGWRIEKPRSVDARKTAVEDILWDLESLNAEAFIKEEVSPPELRQYGLAVPQAAISVFLRGRSEPIKVLIGDQVEGGNYYCTTSESDQVVEISQFIMDHLPDTIEDLEKQEAPDIGGPDEEMPPSEEE
ncbi:MAG: DUF4340 domain-containing protein [Armatimonadota bacterium]|nr:DUF4340 domain-containing protein [Armatimonadota bacterium]